jgi:hypothetical protein
VLTADPIANARRRLDEEGVEEPITRVTPAGTTDQLIADHLNAGPLDWPRLAHASPAVERAQAIAVPVDAAGRSIVLAEAGASAHATASVLRAHGLDDDQDIRAALTATVADSLGEHNTLYPPEAVAAALNEPKPITPLVDELVADLLVSAGRHPSAVLHLAQTSGQPASVIALVEEHLRRHEAGTSCRDARPRDPWTRSHR